MREGGSRTRPVTGSDGDLTLHHVFSPPYTIENRVTDGIPHDPLPRAGGRGEGGERAERGGEARPRSPPTPHLPTQKQRRARKPRRYPSRACPTAEGAGASS